jgi:hypothetical protein
MSIVRLTEHRETFSVTVVLFIWGSGMNGNRSPGDESGGSVHLSG